jgi:hypothetical protein
MSLTFEGQYADLLLGNVDQAYVATRAQKVFVVTLCFCFIHRMKKIL